MEEKIWTNEEFFDRKEKDGIFKFSNGDRMWVKNSSIHRLDGPAVEYSDGSKYWYKDGKRHRLDGPACEFPNGNKMWYIEDRAYSEEEFKILSFAILNKLESLL